MIGLNWRCLVFVLFFFSLACQNNDGFLQKTPEPEPGPSRYAKTYRFNVNTSEVGTVDVDILWVIDNSGSMQDYQNQVIANSAAFISAFTAASQLHWRMGLVSTTVTERPYMGFDSIVDWQTPDAATWFNRAVGRLGTNGDGVAEQAFMPVLNVLHAYPNFLRPGAFLLVIAVSDEPEQGPIEPSEFLNRIHTMLGAGGEHRFGFFAVNGPGSNTTYNRRYSEAVRLTNGKSYDLLSPDYGKLLANLGQDLVNRVSTVDPVILLDQRPVPDTIQVVYKGRILRPGARNAGGEWSYNPVYNFIEIYNPSLIDINTLDVSVSYVLAKAGS